MSVRYLVRRFGRGLASEPQSHSRWEASRITTDRVRAAVAHAALRRLLKDRLGGRTGLAFDRTCRHCGKPHGKPRLAAGDVHFSLAYTPRFIAIALAGDEIGVDAESDGPLRAPLLGPDILAPRERDAVAAVPESAQAREFLRLWTRKEAVLKAIGCGLAVRPSSVDATRDSVLVPRWGTGRGEPQLWALGSVFRDRCWISVATAGAAKPFDLLTDAEFARGPDGGIEMST